MTIVMTVIFVMIVMIVTPTTTMMMLISRRSRTMTMTSKLFFDVGRSELESELQKRQ